VNPFVTVRQTYATYPVYIGRDLLDRVGSLIQPRGKVFVITSPELRGRFGDRVAASFSPRAEIIEMREGETGKELSNAEQIITQLLERGAKRDSMAVAVGGGMIGDTAGFAASITLRGIDLVHVPTTLLAQVDSSIGGKVAVNHPRGKNLIGSFYPPRAVIDDIGALASLPRRELVGGIFEALKAGVVGDAELFSMLEAQSGDLETIVRKAILVKANIVSADEREAGLRRLLNYGHTIGHAIEAATGYEALLHGEAVAWGMIAANAIAVRRGILSSEESSRMEQAILAYDPMPLPAIDRRLVLAAAEHDKKNTGTARVMVFPKRVGECVVVSDVTEEELAYGADAVLSGRREK
jgi:3-dehydroquinate synthase